MEDTQEVNESKEVEEKWALLKYWANDTSLSHEEFESNTQRVD